MIGRHVRLAIAAAITGFLVLAGTTAGFAFWNASNSVSSTVSAATLAITTSNFNSVNYTFSNNNLVTTGSVTVTNTTTTTSSQSGAVSVTFAAVAAVPMASGVTASIWTTASASSCTAAASVPGSATIALWSASPVLTASLAPSASVIYCVRSSALRENIGSAGGSQSFQPKVTATITVGNFTGNATASATQSTQYIYTASTADLTHWNWLRPNFTSASYDYCLDVSGGGSASGTSVISYDCKTSGAANQNWKFVASGATGYYTIQSRGATALRIDNNSSTTAGAAITVNTASTTPASALNQQWELQQVSANTYELVSAYSGLCLTSPGGTAQNLGGLTQDTCAGSVNQQFLVSQALESVACSYSGTSWVWTWNSVTTGPYHLLVTHGTTTSELVTTGATAAGMTLARTAVTYANGTYNYTIADSLGTTVGIGTIRLGSGNPCTVSDLQ